MVIVHLMLVLNQLQIHDIEGILCRNKLILSVAESLFSSSKMMSLEKMTQGMDNTFGFVGIL